MIFFFIHLVITFLKIQDYIEPGFLVQFKSSTYSLVKITQITQFYRMYYCQIFAYMENKNENKNKLK